MAMTEMFSEGSASEPNEGTLTYIDTSLSSVTVDANHDYLCVLLRRQGSDPSLNFNGVSVPPNFTNASGTYRYWLWRIKDVKSGDVLSTTAYTSAEAYYLDFS